MTVRNVSIDELDAEGVEVELSTTQAQLLTESRLVDVRRTAGPICRLSPNGRVGAVRFDNLQIEVRPKEKLGLANLMFLLGFAKSPGFRPDSVSSTGESELWPAMAHSLAAAVERALNAGLLQGYRTEQETLVTVRGRIAFEEQVRRRPGVSVPIEVRFDEFSSDIAENQILLAAIDVMLAVPRIQPETRRRLLHLQGRLTGISRLRRGHRLPPWQPSRINERYHSALGLAEILLENSSVSSAAQGVEMSAFVVVMWKVFEDFVTTALSEALSSRPGYQRAQLPAFLTGEGSWSSGKTGRASEDPHGDIPMNVDLVHFDWPNVPRVVFDAKYKLSSKSGQYASADHYQMLAYCTALQVRIAWLIYAGGGGDVRRRIKNSDIEVVAAPLDLSRPPEQILARVREIAGFAMTSIEHSSIPAVHTHG